MWLTLRITLLTCVWQVVCWFCPQCVAVCVLCTNWTKSVQIFILCTNWTIIVKIGICAPIEQTVRSFWMCAPNHLTVCKVCFCAPIEQRVCRFWLCAPNHLTVGRVCLEQKPAPTSSHPSSGALLVNGLSPGTRGAFFACRAHILSWPRNMCSQVRMLKFLEPSREMP